MINKPSPLPESDIEKLNLVFDYMIRKGSGNMHYMPNILNDLGIEANGEQKSYLHSLIETTGLVTIKDEKLFHGYKLTSNAVIDLTKYGSYFRYVISQIDDLSIGQVSILEYLYNNRTRNGIIYHTEVKQSLNMLNISDKDYDDQMIDFVLAP